MSDEVKQRIHCRVSGSVHGVGFRAATQHQAMKLELTGWVRNRPDGSVEVISEGPEQTLQELITFLHRGPRAAIVRNVDTA